MEIITKSAPETHKFGRKIGDYLKQQDKVHIIKLYGDLGSGKTVLAKGIAQSLGLNAADILSPTFTIVRSYNIVTRLYDTLNHIDLYRLNSTKEIQEIGIKDLINQGRNLTIVEWAEKLPEVTKNCMDVHISIIGNTRQIKSCIIHSKT